MLTAPKNAVFSAAVNSRHSFLTAGETHLFPTTDAGVGDVAPAEADVFDAEDGEGVMEDVELLLEEEEAAEEEFGSFLRTRK